jgi:N4-bis(aminopropyl)spermidine synthase
MNHRVDPGSIGREVATAVALLEGESGVAEVIGIVARLEPVGVRRISRASDLPVPVVSAICGELRKRGVVARERPVRLTPLGRELFAPRSLGAPSTVCPACEGRGVTSNLEHAGLADDLTKTAEEAPPARVEIDQSHCTVDTKLRRVLLMHESGALAGRRVLVLGDDDLTSVAIRLVAEHYRFGESIKEVTVVDVDPAVVEFCRARLGDAPFPARFLDHDLREPLPPRLVHSFDTVFTDPPYTPEGAELFLSRAAAALSPGGSANVFFCAGMKPPDDTLRIQSAITQMGFVIRNFIRNFNEYVGAGSLGGSSHIYHLAPTNATRPLIAGMHRGRLYTGEQLGGRRYLCVSCGNVDMVGPSRRWATVRQLKVEGCPRCGHSKFRPLPRSVPARHR